MFRALKFRIFKRSFDRFKILRQRDPNVRERTFINQPRSSPLYLRSKTERTLPSNVVSTRRMHLLQRAKLELRDRRSRSVESLEQKAVRLTEQTIFSTNLARTHSSSKHPDCRYGLYKCFCANEAFSVLEQQRRLEYRFDLLGLGSKHIFRVSEHEPGRGHRSSESRAPMTLVDEVRAQRSSRLDRYVRLYVEDFGRTLSKFLDVSVRKMKTSDEAFVGREQRSLISFLRAKESSFSRFRLFRLYCREIERTFKNSETCSSFRASLGLVQYVSTARIKLDFSLRASYLEILALKKRKSSFSSDPKSNSGGLFRAEHSSKTNRVETYLTKNVLRTFVVSFSENVLYEAKSRIFPSAIRGSRPFDPIKRKESEGVFYPLERVLGSNDGELRWIPDLRSRRLVPGSSSHQRRESTTAARIERQRSSPCASEIFSTFKTGCLRKNAFDLLARSIFCRSQCPKISFVFQSKTDDSSVFIEKNTGHGGCFFSRNPRKQDRKNVRAARKPTFAFEAPGRSLLLNLKTFSFRHIGARDRNVFSRILNEAYGLDALSFRSANGPKRQLDALEDTRTLFCSFPSKVFEHELSDSTVDFRSLSALKKVIKSLASATQRKLVDRLTRSLYVWSYRHRASFEFERLFELDSRLRILSWRWSVRRHNNKSKGWIKARYFTRFQEKWMFGTVERKERATDPGRRFVYLPSVFQIVFSFGKN